MAFISLKHVNKTYTSDVKAVNDFNLDIDEQEFIVIVGPSGCGKSTVLRMIAGLEDVTEGEIYIEGRLMNHVKPKDRDIAMVFQNYALYPHMSVYENMAFALKLRHLDKKIIDEKIRNAAEILNILPLLNRKPKALSGGERQRAALGRAMVRNPKVFLMDEPLSNLDAKLRTQMRTEILKLHQYLKTTFIYVTHDQTEAMTMGTRIVVMKNGRIQQADKPGKVYQAPRNLFVAGFIGNPQMNFLSADIVYAENSIEAVLKDGTRCHPSKAHQNILRHDYHEGDQMIIGIRPESFYESQNRFFDSNCSKITGKVQLVELTGAERYIHLNIGEPVIARIPAQSCISAGQSVSLWFLPDDIKLFDKEKGDVIA